MVRSEHPRSAAPGPRRSATRECSRPEGTLQEREEAKMTRVQVLLVEDDPMVLYVTRRFLERVPGAEVAGEARTAREALLLLRNQAVDLVLLDIYLPDRSGLILLRDIRHEGMDVDVIVITAASDPTSVTTALRLGACDYLIKPFEWTRFRRAIDAYRCLTRAFPAAEAEELPKGIDATTLARVVELLRGERTPLTVKEIGEKLGVSRITALRYITYLRGRGAVTAEPVYGGPGRPALRYVLKE